MPGDTITYTLTATNTGNVDLDRRDDDRRSRATLPGHGDLDGHPCSPPASLDLHRQLHDHPGRHRRRVDAVEHRDRRLGPDRPGDRRPSGASPRPGADDRQGGPTADPTVDGHGRATMITYTFTVTNTGNVDPDRRHRDRRRSPRRRDLRQRRHRRRRVLDRRVWTCTATYTVTQADIDAGATWSTRPRPTPTRPTRTPTTRAVPGRPRARP